MKITAIELIKVALPMTHSFETSFGRLTTKDTLIVKLYTADGLIGYGESSSFHSPLYNPETVDSCKYIIQTFIAPCILHKNFETIEEFVKAYSFIVGNEIAKAGVETAFWHLLALRDQKSLKELVGGIRDTIPVGESLGIKPSIEEVLQEVDLRVKEGYKRIKVKIKPGFDVEVTRKIREKYPKIDLMLDGNSAYNLKEHLSILTQLDEFNLMMIEQPLASNDIIDHSTLQRLIETPICMDESICSAEDARKAIQTGACKIINIKPGRVGGVLESIKIHDYCEKNNIPVWCGGLLESGIGRAFNIALASKSNYTLPADMSPYHIYFHEDLVENPFEVVNGEIKVPTEIGLGYTPNDATIAKYTVEKVYLK